MRIESLGPERQVSFGTLLFKLIDEDKKLRCAILTADDELWDQLGEKFTANYLKSKKALSDPNIGGLFDSAEGKWLFDPKTGQTYLYRDFPIGTPPEDVNSAINAMAEILPAWSTRWSGVVAEIAQGITSAPKAKVTLKNDPYASRF